jgi:hypothetical protein
MWGSQERKEQSRKKQWRMREVSESDLAQHLWKAYVGGKIVNKKRGRLSTKREGNGWHIELLWTRVEEADGLQHCGPKIFTLLSRVVVMRERGQERQAQNQRVDRFWPPRLATPLGARRGREW